MGGLNVVVPSVLLSLLQSPPIFLVPLSEHAENLNVLRPWCGRMNNNVFCPELTIYGPCKRVVVNKRLCY